MIFTNLGNYLFVPVYKIPDMKWKELGKHINNVVMLNQDEKVIASYMYDKKKTLVFASKSGMIKRTKMEDYEVSRCAKPITAMKLKDNDELIRVSLDYGNIIMVTKNGYYLNIASTDVPIVGAKASGVKGISLKEDELISMFSYDNNFEYVTLFTDNKTAKRVKITDLEHHNRAKKGSTILKKTKTTIYHVLNAFGTHSRDLVLTKADSEINVIKNSDISIMDLASTGSSISKYKLDTASLVVTLEKMVLNQDIETEEEVTIEEEPKIKELSMEDFLDDFKL